MMGYFFSHFLLIKKNVSTVLVHVLSASQIILHNFERIYIHMRYMLQIGWVLNFSKTLCNFSDNSFFFSAQTGLEPKIVAARQLNFNSLNCF